MRYSSKLYTNNLKINCINNNIMAYKNILELVKTGEGYTTEFKERLSADTLGKEMCSFANASGGKIILGVKDNGDILGFTLSNSDKSRIQDIARNMDPTFSITI